MKYSKPEIIDLINYSNANASDCCALGTSPLDEVCNAGSGALQGRTGCVNGVSPSPDYCCGGSNLGGAGECGMGAIVGGLDCSIGKEFR